MLRGIVVAVVFFCSLALLNPPPLRAQTIFDFKGTVISVSNDPTGSLNGRVGAGTPFSGYYSFKGSTLDSNPDPSVGVYDSGAVTGMSLTVENMAFGRFDGLHIRVRNDVGDVEDDYEITVQPPPLAVQEIRLLFRTRNLSRFQSDALPTTPLDVADFSDVHRPVLELSMSSGIFIVGEIEDLTVRVQQPTVFDFTWQVTRLVNAAQEFPTLAIGDVLHGSYTFDANALDELPFYSKIGQYQSLGSPFHVATSIDGRLFGSPCVRIEVASGAPTFNVNVYGYTFSDNGCRTSMVIDPAADPRTEPANIQWNAFSTLCCPIASDLLPLTPPSVESLLINTNVIDVIFFNHAGSTTAVEGRLVSLTRGHFGNTTKGTNVTVVPLVVGGTTGSVSVTFSNVDTAGDTSAMASATGVPPPSGFKLTNPPVYYEIDTTASFTGSVRVCLGWTEGQVANEFNVEIFHYDGQWLNITDESSRDTASNTLCGVTGSLSPFTLFDVKYPFTGFYQPVDNIPTLNTVKAGAAVPVKFSLGGNLGLNILGAGYPRASVLQCQSGEATDAIEFLATAGNSGLSYDSTTGLYNYVWKTDKEWANTCRELQVKFNDGEVYTARFTFTR